VWDCDSAVRACRRFVKPWSLERDRTTTSQNSSDALGCLAHAGFLMRPRNGKRGLALHLFDLEAEIMDVVWSHGLERFAVSDVLVVLERRREIAYTTVMTTVARLHDKGVLDRRRDGKRYLYSPRLSREEFLQSTAREVLRGLSDSSGHGALALLVETVSAADGGVLDELERVIRRRRKQLGS
jgi:predicted transcriptional regulator